jgi:hypothetical protein
MYREADGVSELSKSSEQAEKGTWVSSAWVIRNILQYVKEKN